MKFNKDIDIIQFGILLIMGITMLSGFWAYCSSVFASKESVQELQVEVHAIYLKMIPEVERRHR